jgi:hypothetical protein
MHPRSNMTSLVYASVTRSEAAWDRPGDADCKRYMNSAM